VVRPGGHHLFVGDEKRSPWRYAISRRSMSIPGFLAGLPHGRIGDVLAEVLGPGMVTSFSVDTPIVYVIRRSPNPMEPNRRPRGMWCEEGDAM
jgi:hypothetical protein